MTNASLDSDDAKWILSEIIDILNDGIWCDYCNSGKKYGTDQTCDRCDGHGRNRDLGSALAEWVRKSANESKGVGQ